MSIPKKVVAEVIERAAGYCEACGGPEHMAMALHHRQLRSQGGKNTVENLVRIHHACHREIHAHPERSVQRGHIVPSFRDPGSVPCLVVRWPW